MCHLWNKKVKIFSRNKKCKKKLGKGVVNDVLNSGKLPEIHIPSYSFCGPGTKLKDRLLAGQRGINKLDQACRIHDMSYALFKTPSERHVFDKELQEKAVKIMTSPKSTAKEKIDAGLVAAVMYGKRKLGLGNEIKTNKK